MTVRALLVALVLAASGCMTGLQAPAVPEVAGPLRAGAAEAPAATPAGRVTVAQPDPVHTWWQQHPEDLAAGDLAALWSLPLHRTDPLGRLVPALAESARVVSDTPGWTVEIELATGSWSDGEPVTAADVVATAEALAAARPAQWTAWTGAEEVDEGTVRLHFDRPYGGWSALLSQPPGVLPAHVLAEEGLAAYAQDLPVTGGWFTLSSWEPGRSATFTALPGSPLGAPNLNEVEVLVVPAHDTALGLLDDGSIDLALGHVAIDPQARRSEVGGSVGASVFGGTRVELVWAPEGRADAGIRSAAARRFDPSPFTAGLLREVGRTPGGLLPQLERLPGPRDSADAGGAVSIQYARTVEGLGLLARRLQADLENAGVDTSLVRLDPPQHLAPPVGTDGRLRVVRVAPDRSLAALLEGVGLEPGPGVSADAAGPATPDPMARGGAPTGPQADVAQVLAEDPRVRPVAEVAVTHVWSPARIEGIQPSGWPGIGLWNAGEWSVPSG